MSTIAEQAISRAVTNGITNIDHYGLEIETGYLIQGPGEAEIEWIAPGEPSAAADVTRLLGALSRPGQVLTIERLDQDTLIAETCQHVATAREAHHLSRLRGAGRIYDVKSGKMVEVAETAWIVRTPATALARELLGESEWTYLCDPVGTPRPGETRQEGTAHHYHSRETAERAIREAQKRGRAHATHATAVKVNQ